MDLYRRYGPALLRKCERMLGNRQDAEDVVQGIFIDLLRRDRADVELAYLYRAATTRCLNRLRDRRRRQGLLDRHGETCLAPAQGRLDERIITLDLLVRLVDGLDDKSAEILIYRYLDNMTQEEIAELLATSRKTVGKRLARIQEAVSALAGEGR